jgi:hypothetical protein
MIVFEDRDLLQASVPWASQLPQPPPPPLPSRQSVRSARRAATRAAQEAAEAGLHRSRARVLELEGKVFSLKETIGH